MFTAPRLLTAPEALLLAVAGAAVGVVVASLLARRALLPSRPALAVSAALVASSLAVAPFTAWAIVSDLRAAHRLTDREAARIGPAVNELDTAAIDRVAAVIPRDESYALVLGQAVDPDRARVFRLWSLTALIPRVARTDPRAAQWVISWGVPPRELDIAVTDVRRLEPPDRADPPVYVGRVAP